ncbi:MAG: leucyl aminopeptidase [Deltaproteobacteria bacterium]|nr:leucyl aminopeptidase [Deltaproteobacteria bacterium]
MPLKLSCVAAELTQIHADLLAIGVFEGASVHIDALAPIDHALRGALARLLKREEFTGKKDQTVSVDTLGQIPAHRITIVGLGDKDKLGAPELRAFAARAAREVNATKGTALAIALPELPDPLRVRAVGEGIVLGAYRFTRYLTGERKPKAMLAKAALIVPPGTTIPLGHKKAFELGSRLGESVCITRDLVNDPPNELTPIRLAEAAQKMAKERGLQCRVFDRKELQRRGMKLIIAVAQGSANEPRLVHLIYKPAKASKKRLVVVGKGLTFDSGGLCIKPAQGMGEMKSDMSGAANVVGFMSAVAQLKPAFEVHGIMGCAENMPDGAAYRPGDVFGSFDGKTVEIINTDAEGRLVLADALSYARTVDPTVLLCNATLTGACVVALGQHCSGFYATSDELGERFNKAAKAAGEQFWRMPLLEDMKESLKSDVADLKHTGDRWGGSISAALFLREFVGETPFIHCDIAGPALSDKAYSFYTKGGTGHGVLTFLSFLDQM